jgi:hypothetical protein
MIASAKPGEPARKLNNLGATERPIIHFLSINGSLTEEEFDLSEDKRQYVSINDHQRYGKIESFKDENIHYLKTYRGGRDGEFVPDPYGYFGTDVDLSVQNNQRGGRFCEYQRVTPEVFRSYQIYLHTRVPAYLDGVVKAFRDQEFI